MDKYIFLDIDGVIATPESLTEDRIWGLVDSKQDLLGNILEKTDAKLVISSSWRKHNVEETVIKLTNANFRFGGKIVGVTIRGYNHIEKGFSMSIPRGVEIKHWIDNHICRENSTGAFVRKRVGIDYIYVILDDDNDMLLTQHPYFIHTHPTEGLSQSDAERAIKILNNE
jgi:hypothetical protein